MSSDAETSFTAKIMLVSGVPLLIILAPKIFDVSYNSKAYNIDILVTLFALIVTLLAYFNYQVFTSLKIVKYISFKELLY